MFKWLKKLKEPMTERERWKLGMDPETAKAKKTRFSSHSSRVVSIHNDVVIVNGKRLAKGSKEEDEALKSVRVIMNRVGDTMDEVGKTMDSVGDMFKKMKW